MLEGSEIFKENFAGSEIFRQKFAGSEINYGFFTNTGSKLTEMRIKSVPKVLSLGTYLSFVIVLFNLFSKLFFHLIEDINGDLNS